MKKIIMILLASTLLNGTLFAQWILQTTGTLTILQSIDYLQGSEVLLAAGNSGLILKTTNSGTNWITIPSGTSEILQYVKFRNTSTGYIGGQNGVLLRTTNTGTNWTVLNFGGSETVFGIDMYPTTVLFLATSEGRVYRSDNSGDNFTMLADLTGGGLFTIETLGPGFTTTGGDSGLVFKSTNNGVNWVNISVPASERIHDIAFFNTTTGYCISATKVFKTLNGGSNWTEQASLPPLLLSMYLNRLIGPDTVYASGAGGRMFKTTNAGANWFQQGTGLGDALFSITGINCSELWSCGSSGKILRTTNGGGNFILNVSQISSEVPEKFSLSQNYPNPFNPSTNIRFRLANAGFVTLTVFDALGRESDKLLNENLAAGTFEIQWDASNFPSGIYYYKITSGDLTETKKMILIK